MLALAVSVVQAQPYTIDWYKIAGGDGTSPNGQYSITGTVGQPDAGLTLAGDGNFHNLF